MTKKPLCEHAQFEYITKRANAITAGTAKCLECEIERLRSGLIEIRDSKYCDIHARMIASTTLGDPIMRAAYETTF
jgi:hypothetical protein